MRASTVIAGALVVALLPVVLGALLAPAAPPGAPFNPPRARAAGPTATEQRVIRALEGIERNTGRMAKEIKRCR